jgi:branched-subunit amino acid transport protein AzlD
MQIRKKTRSVLLLIISMFVIGILPWLLLTFEQTKGLVSWLKEIYFQLWGWSLLLCLVIYSLREILSWTTSPKFIKISSVVFALIMLAWSLIWLSLVFLGYIISTIA